MPGTPTNFERLIFFLEMTIAEYGLKGDDALIPRKSQK